MRSRKANGSLVSPQNSLKIPHSRPRTSDNGKKNLSFYILKSNKNARAVPVYPLFKKYEVI